MLTLSLKDTGMIALNLMEVEMMALNVLDTVVVSLNLMDTWKVSPELRIAFSEIPSFLDQVLTCSEQPTAAVIENSP